MMGICEEMIGRCRGIGGLSIVLPTMYVMRTRNEVGLIHLVPNLVMERDPQVAMDA